MLSTLVISTQARGIVLDLRDVARGVAKNRSLG
jgi:hypothetical protein